MPGDPAPIHPPPDPTALAAWQAEIAAAQRDPWRASLFMRRLDTLRNRLAELRDSLASVPRRARRH